jgi:hypothetical protein
MNPTVLDHASPTAACTVARWRHRAAGAALGLLISMGAFAAAPVVGALPSAGPPRAALPSVREIVAANAKARGGLDAWHKINTLTERGRIEHGQMKAPRPRHAVATAGGHALEESLPFTLQFKRPHKMRVEMDLGDLKALQLFDGAMGWTLQPSANGPEVHQYTPSEAAAAAAQVDPEGPLIDAAAKGTKVTFGGEDTVEGHRAYKLKLTLTSGAERNIWIDAQTMLDLKIDGVRVIDGRPWPTETYFYDWKQAGELKVPGRVETSIGDVRTSSRIVVEHVLINEPLSDDLFSIPAGS